MYAEQTPGNFVSHLLRLRGAADDSRIIPDNLEGGEETIASFHFINLLKIAEKTKPENPLVEVTPWNYSKVEDDFLKYLFSGFLGMDEKWFLGRAIGYALMHFSEERENSPHLQRFYRGYADFFESLSTASKMLMLSENTVELDKLIQGLFPDGDDQVRAYEYVARNKGQNWGIIHHAGPFWYVLLDEQFLEVRNHCPSLHGVVARSASGEQCKPETYEPKIKRTDSAVKTLKGIVHEMTKTKFMDEFDPESPAEIVIDKTEKDITGKLMKKRFEGFGELTVPCIDEMLDDVSRKDILFYLALTNRIGGVNVPPAFEYKSINTGAVKTINLANEIYEVQDKVDRTAKLLKVFEGKPVDSESLHLISYALHYIIGIRGLENCSLILQEYGVEKEQLEKMGLHDVPAMAPLSRNIDYSFKNSKVPGIKELVSANPGAF